MKDETPYLVEKDGDGTRERLYHPSLGAVKVFRTSGQRRLNGSDFQHQHYVSIEIHTAHIERDLAHDWHFDDKNIMRFCMSEAQWAHFVSSVGNGSGTLITFDHRPMDDSKLFQCPGVPYRDESTVTIDEGSKAVAAAGQAIDDLSTALEANLAGLTKAKQEILRKHVWRASRALKDTLPFIDKSFRERMEERVIKAKIEVAAWTEGFIRRTGIKVLQNRTPISLKDPTDGD